MAIMKLPGESTKDYRARWMREWRAANPDIKNDSQYKWKRRNPDKYKESRCKYLAHRLEQDPAYYTNKQRKQQGLPEPTRACPDLCEGCGCPESRKSKTGKVFSLSLDHCHRTGQFRGWLCGRCNTVLGRFNDDYTLIKRLANYAQTNSPGGN